MARNFKAEEEELDLWFDEQKENLSKKYFSQVDESKNYPSLDEERKSKKVQLIDRKSIEKQFLIEMEKIRRKYQAKYDKIKADQDNLHRRKEFFHKLLSPFYKPFSLLFHLFMIFFMFLKNDVLKGLVAFFKKTVKFFKDKQYYAKEYYTFHIKPHTRPYTWPIKRLLIKIFFRPMNKLSNKITDIKKKAIEDFNKKLKVVIEFGKKYGKIILNWLKARYKKVSEVVGKVMAKYKEFKNKYITPITDKIGSVFKKKE